MPSRSSGRTLEHAHRLEVELEVVEHEVVDCSVGRLKAPSPKQTPVEMTGGAVSRSALVLRAETTSLKVQ